MKVDTLRSKKKSETFTKLTKMKFNEVSGHEQQTSENLNLHKVQGKNLKINTRLTFSKVDFKPTPFFKKENQQSPPEENFYKKHRTQNENRLPDFLCPKLKFVTKILKFFLKKII